MKKKFNKIIILNCIDQIIEKNQILIQIAKI